MPGSRLVQVAAAFWAFGAMRQCPVMRRDSKAHLRTKQEHARNAPGRSTMPAYAELEVTTNFSFLEGASHPEELVERAKELGLAAIAVTDRNSLAGWSAPTSPPSAWVFALLWARALISKMRPPCSFGPPIALPMAGSARF